MRGKTLVVGGPHAVEVAGGVHFHLLLKVGGALGVEGRKAELV